MVAAAPPIARLGLVGLGLVGRALVARARAAGITVTGCDVAAGACAAAAALGVAIRPDAASVAAASDAVLIAVLDDAQLAGVMAALLAAPVRPRLALHAVTADPDLTARLAVDAAAAGIDLVEMPLSGSSTQIAAGEALALVGATAAGWAAAGPLVAALSPEHVHVGAPGAGARAKLATNLVLGLNRAVLAEGILFAESLGLEAAAFLALLRRSPAYSRAVDTAGPRMVAGDWTPVSRLVQHHKDLRLMLARAAQAGIDLPFTRTHAAVLADAEAQGKGRLDNVAILAALRDRVPDGNGG